MKIYHLDPQSNQLVCEGLADPSPLEPGVWLVPAHATAVPPPAAQDGKTQHFVDGAWVYVDIPPPPPPPPIVPLTPLEQIRALEAEHADYQAQMTRQVSLAVALEKAMQEPAAAGLTQAQVHAVLMSQDNGYKALFELEQAVALLRAQIP